jgi:transcriptional regulator NrdR family protein
MRCPICNSADSGVRQTSKEDNRIYRRRRCASGHMFTTTEIVGDSYTVKSPTRVDEELLRDLLRVAERVRYIVGKQQNPEGVKARQRRSAARRQARELAAETGRPVKDIYAEMGVS